MPKPTKEQIRDYMERRRADRRAPPDMKQIQRELAWELTELEQEQERLMRERRVTDRRQAACVPDSAVMQGRMASEF